jgi:hypothetical protein
MVHFNEAAVQLWVAAVQGLSPAQRAAAMGEMAEDEYDGQTLVGANAKTLRRLLKGSAAAEAVPLLLAARDAQLAREQQRHVRVQQDEAAAANAAAEAAAVAETATAAAAEAAAAQAEAEAAAPSCPICLEPYGTAVVARMLVACGHTACTACLDKMLRCAPSTACIHQPSCAIPRALSRRMRVRTRPLQPTNGRKRLPCPICRTPCKVKGGRAKELPRNYAVMGA